jgi:hypothetical protein
VPAPAAELAQVESVGLAGQAAVSGQEPGEREPLGTGEGWLDGGEGSRSRGGHQGTSRNSRDLGGWAAEGPSDERCPQRMALAEDELHHDS